MAARKVAGIESAAPRIFRKWRRGKWVPLGPNEVSHCLQSVWSFASKIAENRLKTNRKPMIVLRFSSVARVPFLAPKLLLAHEHVP